MIYSFKISKDFFLNLQNKLDYNQSLSILNFFGELFLNRENLLYFDNRKIISDANLAIGPNASIVKELQQLLSKNIKPIEKLNNVEVDILFTNEISKNQKKTNISIDEILNKRVQITKKIKDLTPNKWFPNRNIPQNQLKKDITNKLKRIFRYSDKIYFVDAYLPDHLVNQNVATVKSFKNSFKFFADLASNVKNVEFYNGVKIRQLAKKKVDKNKLENTLKNFYLIFKSFKSPVFVKSDETKAFKTMYERMFVTFLDDINIGIFTVERGLNIITNDDQTTEGRKITKQDADWAHMKLEEWSKYVDKSDNFIFFNTSNLISN